MSAVEIGPNFASANMSGFMDMFVAINVTCVQWPFLRIRGAKIGFIY